MIKKIARSSALDLIKQVHKVEIFASLSNIQSKSAFELLKQMQSTKFTEKNPKYECIYHNQENINESPKLKVKYSNNMEWEIDTTEYSSQRLREALFTRAHDVEVLETIASAERPDDL